jgi:hypothetical protein
MSGTGCKKASLVTKKEIVMNELLFTPGMQVPARLAQVIVSQIESSPRARQLLAFTAAVAVNVAVLAILQLSAAAARYTPPGEVVVTQLDAPVVVRVAHN